MQAVQRVDENLIGLKQKKSTKRREGGGMYEDDTTLTIDIQILQKFGKLSVSVPTDVEELP